MGVARPANPSLRRVFVASDDSIKALYDDNSVLLLNTCGNTFTSIDQHGSRTTQLTLFALKRYHTKLAEVVSFRNLHTEATLSVPYLSPSTHSLGYTVTAVRWPTTLAEAAAEGLLQTEPDGSIALDSHDHAARVVLHVNRCRLAVCYPLLTSTCEHKHDYSWQTQLFATWECPDCWQYPLSLLQAAVQEEHHVSEQQQEQLAANSTSQLPTAFSPDTTLSGVPKHTWWQDCSDRLPTDIAIKLEWTPEALYQYSPSTGEVAVWIHADESCLISEQDGRFFRHCTGQPELERLYAAEAVPTNTTGSTRHPLGAMANHATALRQLNSKVRNSNQPGDCCQSHSVEQSRASLSEEAMQLCHQVHEEHKVQDLGKFTAFQDGSVRVAFEDRALLYMEPEGMHCNVITPEGQKVHVAVANPLGVEQYVAEAVEFAAWAFCSPAQRSAVLQQAANIQKELDRCQRSALLCDWAQGHVVDVQTAAEVSQAEHVVYDALSDCHKHSSSVTGFLAVSDGQLDSQKRQQLIESFLTNNNQLLNTL